MLKQVISIMLRFHARRLSILITLSILVLLSTSNTVASDPGAQQFRPSQQNILQNGTVVYEGWQYYSIDPAGSALGIASTLNISIEITVVVSVLSDTEIEFVSEYDFSVMTATQTVNETTYSLASYDLQFYAMGCWGDMFDCAGSHAPPVTVTRNVDRLTGRNIMVKNPYGGAEYMVVAAYFDSDGVHPRIESWPILLKSVGDQSWSYLANASDLTIGYQPILGYKVTDSNSYEGREALALDLAYDDPRFTIFDDRMLWDTETGLLLAQDTVITREDNFYLEYHLTAASLDEIIVPAGQGIALVAGVGGATIIVLAIGLVIRRRV